MPSSSTPSCRGSPTSPWSPKQVRLTSFLWILYAWLLNVFTQESTHVGDHSRGGFVSSPSYASLGHSYSATLSLCQKEVGVFCSAGRRMYVHLCCWVEVTHQTSHTQRRLDLWEVGGKLLTFPKASHANEFGVLKGNVFFGNQLWVFTE